MRQLYLIGTDEMDGAFFARINGTSHTDGRDDCGTGKPELICQAQADLLITLIQCNCYTGYCVAHAQAAARCPWLVWLMPLLLST